MYLSAIDNQLLIKGRDVPFSNWAYDRGIFLLAGYMAVPGTLITGLMKYRLRKLRRKGFFSKFAVVYSTTLKNNKMTYSEIIALMRREVVPAIGCTEPMCVALCVAYATEQLGREPEKITVRLSANILKNAMGVGIPGTGMVGLPIAIALGALIGKSEYQLEVLHDCTPEAVTRGKNFIAEGCIHIDLEEKACDNLYVDVSCEAGDNTARAIIAREHTRLVYLSRNGEVLTDERDTLQPGAKAEEQHSLTLRKVYDFAVNVPLADIDFIYADRVLNYQASKQPLKGN